MEFTHKYMNAILSNQSRRLLSLFATSALLALASGCVRIKHTSTGSYSADDFKVETTRTVTGAFPADLKNLEIDNRSGEIRIVATETSSGQWSWKLKTHAKTEALAIEAGNAVTCQPVREGDHVRLAVVFPDSSKYRASFESDLEIQVPKAIALRTANRYGATTISGIGGDVDATGQSGSMELSNIGGKVRAQNSYASLKLHGAASATLKNQSGSIEVSDIHGPLDAETSYATLTAQNIESSIRIRNQSGSVEVNHVKGDADLQTSYATLSAKNIAGSLKARDQSGSVKVHGIKGNADIKTSYAELSAQGISGDVILANQCGRISAKDITGSVKAATTYADLNLETASQKINCQNQSGSIRVRATSPEIAGIEAKTSYGKMEVLLPAGLKPVIQAHTTYAEVESDYPIIPKPATTETLAEADPAVPRINLQNQSGAIRIVREKATAAR
ncbi:MAG: hypothetical protein JWQ71_4588 [Pedosphaera sp.]|nr:hypothetical protein [Pedosphaera sp.]